MVDPIPYIGEKPKGGLKTKIGISLVVLSIGTASYFALRDYVSQQKSILEDKKVEWYYSGLEKNLDTFLDKHPDIANKLVRDSIYSLDRSQAKIEPETYLLMFNKIKDKAEENPEIMDHFGPEAQKYNQDKVYKKYMEKVEDSLEKGKKKLEVYIQDLKENEKIKDIYNNIVEGIKTMVRGSDN